MIEFSSHLNVEIANFFRCHSKNTKLTKEESEYIDNLLFTQSSPTKKTLPLFPRATPFGKETPFTNSKYSSFSSTGLKSSKKRLEVFDKDLRTIKPSFSLAEEASISNIVPFEKKTEINIDEITKNFPSDNFTYHNPTKSFISSSPPRQMTDAAKELMANISMNVDAYPEPQEIISHLPKHIENPPSFEFKIPDSSLPEFCFDISLEKTGKVIEKQSEFIFNFDISGYSHSSGSKTHISDRELPKFYFYF